MPQADAIQFVNIRDFTPGIADNPGVAYPPGQAQRTKTFRCISNRAGALTPLPKFDVPFNCPDDNGSTPAQGGYAVSGLFVPPTPVLGTGTVNPNITNIHELLLAVEYTAGGNRHVSLRRYRIFESPGTAFNMIRTDTFADTPVFQPTGFGFVSTRSNRAVPTTPGMPVTVVLYPAGATNSYLIEYPDDQAATIDTPYVILAPEFAIGIAGHQGRVVIQHVDAYDQGTNAATFMGENLKWTAVNDVTTGNISVEQVFVEEDASGYAFIVGMSANELFAVKQQGGLYVVGDLNNPTVVNLPMVVGSDLSQAPHVTSFGVVYGNRSSGVWVWSHGDTCTLLSPKLNPDFWMIPGDTFGGVHYGFASCDEWVLAPNNWLYDSTLKSWWRLEDTAVTVIRYYSVFLEYIYGSQSYYSHENLTGVRRWTRGTSTSSYSWQSQPLWETVDKFVDIQEVTVRAVGRGTVNVTITPQVGSAMTRSFVYDTTLPVLKRNNFYVKGDNVSVLIEVTAIDGNTAAPTVYECNVGYVPAERVPSP